MKPLLLALALSFTMSTQAQELPDKPVPTVTVPVTYPPDRHVEHIAIPVPHRTVDDVYIEWNSGMFMVSAADSALALRHPRYEVNPLMKHRPGVATAAGLLIDGGVLWLDRKWKREDDAMRAAGIPFDRHDVKWWHLPALVTAIRAVGLVSDVAAIH